MDRIIIKSKLFRWVLSKVIKRAINKSCGVDSGFTLHSFNLGHDDGVTKITACFTIEASDEDIVKLFKEEA